MDDRDSNCRIVLQKKIILTGSQKQVLVKHSNENKPNESCAILFGTIQNDKSLVKEIFLADNVEKSPINFTISNKQLIEAYKLAEEKKLEIIGIFHSHPDSIPNPSKTDVKFMEINPTIWIIYSGITNEFKAFILEPEITEVSIQEQM